MSKNTSTALGERHIAYAHRKIESGEVSEVVRDADAEEAASGSNGRPSPLHSLPMPGNAI